MTLNDLVAVQRAFDARHGWTPDQQDVRSVLNFLARDTIGLVGEVGEFANELKKLQLVEGLDEFTPEWSSRLPNLSEEIVDTLIYVIRIASHLEIDLEVEYATKLEKNRARFAKFERPSEQ
ncbi:hypothetical protein NKH85_19725 [Mesorhizobium sp. M0924]|uniref:hypothetical protein n=1 Tax=unclassified Mesorhizobium TaxID=325217 RepID=UPI0033352868